MRRLALAAALLLIPLEGFGQEVILTPSRDPEAAPQTSPDHDKRKEMGDWARGILDRAATGEPAPKEAEDADDRRCPAAPDRKPHGVVWGTVGSGGYTEVGAVVTQAIGECGSVTVGVSRSEGGRGYRRRR